MYAWIWNHLPFARARWKALTSLVTVVGLASLLWFVVFPIIEPKMPFNDGQLDGTGEVTTSEPATSDSSAAPQVSGSAPSTSSSSESSLGG